ncbi:penicillin-binding protein 1A [Caulobacter sp. 17J65-9]|uniref:penicillin-binding protein 1A n=1 Tax=Caulobacter sp. 17J65-9 TaxID=2709382 RepID=UPI0013C72B2E|nr:penicillin-binding protein 1A [Caulobacter sp. 17J65-9]NEX92573.1 penicillin-binding protein 1A [Caulobacter sp. 17J65-9]
MWVKSAERWFAMAGVAVMSVVAVAGLALAIYAAWLFHDMPDAGELAEYRPATATRVYAWDGTLIGEFSRERRIFVPYDEIPPVVVQAFLAAEDRNFFQHGGIDVGGMGRAVAKAPLNVVRGRRLEGGSTITQQVAKNVLLSNEPTLSRKLKEAILARRLEATLEKKQILELYLNEIFLGYRSYGVASAAYNYFGKPLNKLTVAEAAYLAALPKGPNNYHPIKHKAQAKARRDWIIGEMAQMGWITREQAKEALAQDLVVESAPSRAKYKDADFFVEEVRRRALGLLGEEVNKGGYYMRTTLDPRLQTAARVALMDGLENYDRRHGWRGAWGNVEIAPGWEKQALAKKPPAERSDWRAAIVESAGADVRVRLPDGASGHLAPEDVAWARAGAGLKHGDLIFVQPSGGGAYRLRQVPAVNGALVAMEPYSGRVVAMVGGYSYSLSNFNRATQAMRQPGSAFKPFVYATALENDFTPASIVLDAPISFTDRAGNVWSPENYHKKFYGPQTLRKGLELSRNVMTVRLAQQVGMKKIRENAIRYGVVKDMAPVLSMALGAGETTPYDLTAAYAMFTNGGRKIQPHMIELVADRDGEIVHKADGRRCPGCARGFSGDESPRIVPGGEQVMDPITAYQITSYLEGVVQRGTAVQARVLGRPVAGKTGTTNEYRSAWFVGYTPDLVVGVFIGFDDNRSLGEGEAGAVTAVPVFVNFMTDAMKGKPIQEFPKPKDAKFVMVRGIEEAFRPGTEPKPRVFEPDAGVAAGPQAYDDVWRDGQVSGAGSAGEAAQPKPAPKKVPEDLNGLY